jgi:hypothetical protein
MPFAVRPGAVTMEYTVVTGAVTAFAVRPAPAVNTRRAEDR